MGGLNQIISSLSGQAPVPRLTYNPGPGIYSRLERAVEAMPENVRVQELPGLLKRYREGVPGWELKATNLDEVIAGRDVVPRDELLARVREASPVYTHGEVVLRDPEMSSAWEDLASAPAASPSPLGRGSPEGVTGYADYSQGGKDYTEILLTQPNADGSQFGSHWHQHPNAVAHARFDVHDGYLRVNELQSDLGIHNRKARERGPGPDLPVPPGGAIQSFPAGELPFPMEDAALELLLKRLNLYAAKNGLRGVEIASPRAIADKVGGNIENYQHAYGKVAVGNQQRLARKLGGMAEDPYASMMPQGMDRPLRTLPEELQGSYEFARDHGRLVDASMASAADSARVMNEFSGWPAQGRTQAEVATDIYDRLAKLGYSPVEAQAITSRALFEAPRTADLQTRYVNQEGGVRGQRQSPVIYRGTMSDEMRRRIIEQGIGASVLAPLLMQDE
jgi:hypothetical protein